ncbi:glycosyltransferase involved in cell wall biosynthesis [Isoptericola jiangsuensis]|uniref:D-inositol 3-phosphate glycosyltransferase n=1 Tax=Isoptericola jiangsuensis TaxID=548579 RepID=A0A2A9F1M8_9MICO|nr:glycosyltransferase family 4 protein [Isoptericola jiangsuensis]PFG44319.1 glycosyltransferase involved in cell wall biosynthesis [Isoptericola jiangsuensis]
MRNTTPRNVRRHLLLVTHHYTPERNAPQRRWDALAPRLIAAGVDVSVLAPPPHYPDGDLAESLPEYAPGRISRGVHGERIVRTRYRRHTASLRSRSIDQAVSAWSSIRLGLRLFRHPSMRPDIVVGTVPGIPSMFAAWVLARGLRARFVVEMRDAWPDLIEPAGLLEPRRTVRGRIVRTVRATVHRTVSRLQGRADAVVTTTETFAEVLRSRGVEQVAVVRNGTSFTPVRPEDANESGGDQPSDRPLHHRPLRAAYAGTIGRAQDLATVVRAAARLRDRGVDVDVRVVGTGTDVERLRTLAAALDAPVSISGPVTRAEVRKLYAWADTLLISLRDWPPLEWTVPSKLYEVMAAARPATACVAGEAASLVAENGAGAVVMPGDVDGLMSLWSTWVAEGAPPEVSSAAAHWVAENADDDVLGSRYVDLVDHILAPARHDDGDKASATCPACLPSSRPPEHQVPPHQAAAPHGARR